MEAKQKPQIQNMLKDVMDCYNVTAFDSNWAYVMSPSKTVSNLVSEDLK